MIRVLKVLAAGFCISLGILSAGAHAAPARTRPGPPPQPPQETGFLNRKVEVHGATYRFQVYLPEEFRHDDHKQWPILLFLHGRGERGAEGMWQTQIGLPLEVRDHPERWPFVIVMPQCPYPNFWTDPGMLDMAIAALDQEAAEFHADPTRNYLAGLSLGGYGAWELARLYPRRPLLELRPGALATGRHPPVGVRARRRTHPHLALPRQRGQRGSGARK